LAGQLVERAQVRLEDRGAHACSGAPGSGTPRGGPRPRRAATRTSVSWPRSISTATGGNSGRRSSSASGSRALQRREERVEGAHSTKVTLLISWREVLPAKTLAKRRLAEEGHALFLAPRA
jgi:hypothetical protein